MTQFDINAAVGQALRAVRDERGETRTSVAARTGLSQGTIYSYETGKRTPDIKALATLAEAYEVGPDEFMPSRDDIQRAARHARGEEKT